MRVRLLFCALLAALLAAPAGAQAAVTVGIGENQPRMFSDPNFQRLGVKHARVVASWNVMTSGTDEIYRLTTYLEAAQQQGVQPLVTFQHAMGNPQVCRKASKRRKPQCVLPSARAFQRNFKLFRQRFPQVKTFAPWNEINHHTQPTSRNPKAAARFTDIARKNCKGCTIVVADLLDQADNTRSKRPTYRKAVSYIRTFRQALKSPRKICGLHNYSDTNRLRDTGTKVLIKALGCKQIWLTETGGVYSFARFKPSASRQLKATKHMFKVARKYRSIKRLYVYSWFGNVNSFDSGLVPYNSSALDGPGFKGKPRKAYFEVKKRV